MNRRDSFEIYWAEQNDVPVETMAQYRCDDDRQYRLPKMASRYRVWCAALDSVAISLPEKCEFAEPDGDYHKGYRQGIRAMVEIAETAGLKVSG